MRSYATPPFPRREDYGKGRHGALLYRMAVRNYKIYALGIPISECEPEVSGGELGEALADDHLDMLRETLRDAFESMHE